MPRLNAIWDAVMPNAKTAWGASRKGGYTAMRAAMSGVKAADRTAVGYATRAMAGATTGALIGAGWGAISDQESIVGGAMKGAFVGAGIRTGMRGLNIKSTRGLTKFNNARGFRENLSRSWKIMSESKNRNLRNMIVGVGAFQGVRGMMSGRDNPLGGGVSGGIAGGIQGAALYGGYRGIKSMGFFK